MQLFSAAPKYSDLSRSNYVDALDWLKSRGLVTAMDEPIGRPDDVFLSEIENVVSALDPEDLPSPQYLPSTILDVATVLGVSDQEAWERTLALGRKIDLERRDRIGRFGEVAMVEHLSSAGCDVRHCSLESDELGWDLYASYRGVEKHLEIKTTTSLARLRIYLSRHEYRVSQGDPAWALVVVLISPEGQLVCYGHVFTAVIADAIPTDTATNGRWESCSINLSRHSVNPGPPLPIPCDGIVGLSLVAVAPEWWPHDI